jgi:CheY-like chemotaxis protein
MKTIWVIDDSTIILELLEHTIKSFFVKNKIDIELKLFDRAYKAYSDLSAETKPDLIITDIEMPKMTGIEFIAKIRSDKYDGKVMVITGALDKDTQEINLLLAEGDNLINSKGFKATEIWEKPINLEKLLSEIKDYLLPSV